MPLDPWIIEEIKKREEEQRRREEEERREQPRVPADDSREMPERPVDRGPGYEMPNPADPKRDERSEKQEGEKRGVFQIDIGGNGDDDAIDISKIPASEEGPEDDEKRPE